MVRQTEIEEEDGQIEHLEELVPLDRLHLRHPAARGEVLPVDLPEPDLHEELPDDTAHADPAENEHPQREVGLLAVLSTQCRGGE